MNAKQKHALKPNPKPSTLLFFFLSLSLLLIQITCNICNIVDDGLLSVVCAILRIYGTNRWQSFLVKLIQLRYKMCAAYLFFIKGKANSYMFSIELFSTVIWNARIFFSPNYVQKIVFKLAEGSTYWRKMTQNKIKFLRLPLNWYL